MQKRHISDELQDAEAIIRNAIAEADAFTAANPDLFQERPTGRMTIHEALTSDNPLEQIRLEMDDRNPMHRRFILLYAAAQDVFSAGTAILFDRYNKADLAAIYQGYQELGAAQFCASMEALTNFIQQKLGTDYTEEDYWDLCDTEEFAQLDREVTLQYQAISHEMEAKLLEFARQHL